MNNKRQFSAQEARAVGTQLGLDWTKIDLEQFRRGLEVELEHGAIDPEAKVNAESVSTLG
jgi:hypothetical protein